MQRKWVYHFNEGTFELKPLLGGKGAGLAEMTNLGLPVPPGFTITTEACNFYLAEGYFPPELWSEMLMALEKLEHQLDRRLGSGVPPLLVSVRSGAAVSMPGMMDTVLNLGLNDSSVLQLAEAIGQWSAFDSYRRLLSMFGQTVLDLPAESFESLLSEAKSDEGVGADHELSVEALKRLIVFYQQLYLSYGQSFPQDPLKQLEMAITAVFNSWNSRRAERYRKAFNISATLGTAVNIQAMVFGNLGDSSGTGVVFSRNPSTGENCLFGEYLPNAQGEDVVSSARTPMGIEYLKAHLPPTFQLLEQVAQRLETHFADLQDMEFTIEQGRLWLLQTRRGERTAQAAVKIAVELAKLAVIDKNEAVRRVQPSHLEQLLHPRFSEESLLVSRVLAIGLNASPGAAVGSIVFDADTAQLWADEGRDVILVRPETNPDDIHGMVRAKGILTKHGGATSHAAVVARGLGIPCVVGCEASLQLDLVNRTMFMDGETFSEGDIISIDGGTGKVYLGSLPMITSHLDEQPEVSTLLEWANDIRRLEVWANADSPKDAEAARRFGAQGIGLCRVEHAILARELLDLFRSFVLAKNESEQTQALDSLLPLLRDHFAAIFRQMAGLPVVIRLLDPPVHEFFPRSDELLVEITTLRLNRKKVPGKLAQLEKTLVDITQMEEANPMLGLRGVRLGLKMPLITKLQVRAILEAVALVRNEGNSVHPKVMVPLISHCGEVIESIKLINQAVSEFDAHSPDILKIGVMMETPRAAIIGGETAPLVDFASIGSNDLTQMTWGLSRDDAEGKFLLWYIEQGILPENPFQSLDVAGVGRLIALYIEESRAKNPGLEIGICGEHGGDPKSIWFCHKVGLDYVSCSPYRIPIAQLSAAHAALDEN